MFSESRQKSQIEFQLVLNSASDSGINLIEETLLFVVFEDIQTQLKWTAIWTETAFNSQFI